MEGRQEDILCLFCAFVLPSLPQYTPRGTGTVVKEACAMQQEQQQKKPMASPPPLPRLLQMSLCLAALLTCLLFRIGVTMWRDEEWGSWRGCTGPNPRKGQMLVEQTAFFLALAQRYYGQLLIRAKHVDACEREAEARGSQVQDSYTVTSCLNK